ncbi:MAG TPA: hypothetical protein VHQ23_09980 [Ilumatobacteraceae bacterium]|nr:hypothetical protein [Ilumatobacteraceae bacterium]
MPNSWGSLKAVTDEAKQIAQDNQTRPLLDCPLCGNRLVIKENGTRDCDVGHFRTTETTQGSWQ